jgi:hypothetical protein
MFSTLSITAHVGAFCEMTQTEFLLIANGICTNSGVMSCVGTAL